MVRLMAVHRSAVPFAYLLNFQNRRGWSTKGRGGKLWGRCDLPCYCSHSKCERNKSWRQSLMSAFKVWNITSQRQHSWNDLWVRERWNIKVWKYCFKSFKKEFDKWLLMAGVFNQFYFLGKRTMLRIWLVPNSGHFWPPVVDNLPLLTVYLWPKYFFFLKSNLLQRLEEIFYQACFMEMEIFWC